MVDTPQTYQYRVSKQPNTIGEIEQIYGTASKNNELGSAINSSTSFMCGDLMRYLCCCCYCSITDSNNSDSCCCCDGCCDCDNCDCDGCDCGDCGGCDCGDCGGCDCAC
jgi:hypothetical protein